MTDLKPEKRLDRLGKLVTRWVKNDVSPSKKNSILGTVIPTLAPAAENYIKGYAQSDKENREHIIRTLQDGIRRDFANQVTGRIGQDRIKAISRMQDKLDKLIPVLRAMELETLQVLAETPCSRYSLIDFVLLRGDFSELEFRERMQYMVVMEDGDSALHKRAFFTTVRDALDVDDLSVYPRGSTEHEVVAASLYLLHQDFSRRVRTKDAPKDTVDDAYMRKLMGFLMEQPDKAISIQRFLVERDVGLDEVDFELLDEYLTAPIPTIADGLL